MTAMFMTPVIIATESDPITAFLTRDWAALGGWSLFVAISLFIVIGAFREWWVPGPRHRRVESAAAEQSKTLATTVEMLKEQSIANEITKHFFEKTVPKRGEPQE
ncbi:hypothetical protein PBI_COUNT_4 [Microbacterium phage Count]|nr:hypothetical protein PBI_COUNT_4 [Microbacterium phage Count]